jgi:hypothetical protein
MNSEEFEDTRKVCEFVLDGCTCDCPSALCLKGTACSGLLTLGILDDMG